MIFKTRLLLFGYVYALAGAKGEGNVEVILDVEEGIALFCKIFLEEGDLFVGSDVGVGKLFIDFLEFVLDAVEIP